MKLQLSIVVVIVVLSAYIYLTKNRERDGNSLQALGGFFSSARAAYNEAEEEKTVAIVSDTDRQQLSGGAKDPCAWVKAKRDGGATLPSDSEPLQHNSKILLQNVQSGKYMYVSNSGSGRIGSGNAGTINYLFTIKTVDVSENFQDNHSVILKSDYNGKFLISLGYVLKGLGNNRGSSASHFNVSNIPRTSPIKEGDTVVFTRQGYHVGLKEGEVITNSSAGRLVTQNQFKIVMPDEHYRPR